MTSKYHYVIFEMNYRGTEQEIPETFGKKTNAFKFIKSQYCDSPYEYRIVKRLRTDTDKIGLPQKQNISQEKFFKEMVKKVDKSKPFFGNRNFGNSSKRSTKRSSRSSRIGKVY